MKRENRKNNEKRRPGQPAEEREGAIMIVVMLVLLTVTALAIYSVQATSWELRAAGHSRQAMQSQYLGESGVISAMAMMDDPTWGPNAFLHSERQTQASISSGGALSKPVMAPFEPELMLDKFALRIYSEDLNALIAQPPVGEDGLGARGGLAQTHTPMFYVDIGDHHTWTGDLPGYRADGSSRLQFMHATYTSRGRLRLRGGDWTGAAAIDGARREYHELASDARATGISGPFAP